MSVLDPAPNFWMAYSTYSFTMGSLVGSSAMIHHILALVNLEFLVRKTRSGLIILYISLANADKFLLPLKCFPKSCQMKMKLEQFGIPPIVTWITQVCSLCTQIIWMDLRGTWSLQSAHSLSKSSHANHSLFLRLTKHTVNSEAPLWHLITHKTVRTLVGQLSKV